jgi:hypothetical protein
VVRLIEHPSASGRPFGDTANASSGWSASRWQKLAAARSKAKQYVTVLTLVHLRIAPQNPKTPQCIM